MKRHKNKIRNKQKANALKIKLISRLKEAKQKYSHTFGYPTLCKNCPRKDLTVSKRKETNEHIIESYVVITDSAEMADCFNLFVHSVFTTEEPQLLSEITRDDTETSTPGVVISLPFFFSELLCLGAKKVGRFR